LILHSRPDKWPFASFLKTKTKLPFFLEESPNLFEGALKPQKSQNPIFKKGFKKRGAFETSRKRPSKNMSS